MIQIKDLFNKQIARRISGVIKIGNGEENRHQELEEYVVTKELNKYFAQFFHAFVQTTESSQNEIGVWISGFYGSGKSHFMKILSYLVENKKINDKRPVDYFIEGKKIVDPIVLANMEKAAEMSTDVILFDIESMSQGRSDTKEAVLRTFLRMFNEKLGYDGTNPSVAEFERYSDENGLYETFKQKYFEITGKNWVEDRKNIKFRRNQFIEAVTSLNIMDNADATELVKRVHSDYNISVSDFAQIVNEYCERKGNNHRVIFLADEMGQYIADNTKLLLNLQTISSDFSTYCKGKAWIVVTSQQNIDEVTHVQGEDFSKIQARFHMRLALSSSDVAEVIQKRILDKTDAAKQSLMAYYDTKEAVIKNLIDFSADTQFKRKYSNSENFANVYPFIPYQMDLLGNVLTQIRIHSSSGKHLAEGERSMLALIQESAVAVSNLELGTLVSFNRFYACLEKWIDHSYRNMIDDAARNEELEPFDVELLKTLFMIKYVKEIKADIKNLTTLMVEHIETDRVELSKQVNEALKRLVKQTYVQKDGDYYTFLTNAEQDLNRLIKNEYVEHSEIVNEMKTIIFGELYNQSKYQYNSRYSFAFNQRIDDTNIVQNYPIGLVIITPYNDNRYTKDDIRQLTVRESVAVFKLPDEIEFQSDIVGYLQLKKYLTKNSGSIDPTFQSLKYAKQDELNKTKNRIKLFIESGLKEADVFVNGSEINIANKGVKERINEALSRVVSNVYSKLTYMETAPDQQDFIKIFAQSNNVRLEGIDDTENQNALNEVYDFVELRNSMAQQVSYKNILDKFTKEPYGFVYNDIHWLTIKLFKTRKIELKINGSLIQEMNTTSDVIVRTITSSANFDKLIIRKKPVISPKQIKAVNDICKELNRDYNKINDSDLLFQKAKDIFTQALEDVEQYYNKYISNPHLPGQKQLTEYKNLIKDLKVKSDPIEFYQEVDNKYDEVMDAIEDVESVFKFFNGSQYTIFVSAQDWLQKIHASETFIGINDIINSNEKEIERIIHDVNPFGKIQNLPIMIEKLDAEFKQLLTVAKNKVVVKIEQERTRVRDTLNDDQRLIDIFDDEIKREFDSLHTKLSNSTTLSEAYNVETEARYKRDNLIGKINSEKENVIITDEPGPDPVFVPSIKTFYADDLINGTEKTIANLQEVENLVNSLRNKLTQEIKNGNIIKIRIK